jgi:hypothetical protein
LRMCVLTVLTEGQKALFIADTRFAVFPQAFSHLALIEAAGRIILGERLAEIT